MSLYSIISDRLSGRNLAASTSKEQAPGKRTLPFVPKAVSMTRQDMKSWNNAQQLTTADQPKNWQIQLLYNVIVVDALLTSQIENRIQQPFSIGFTLKDAKGNKDDEQTDLLKKMSAYRSLSMLKLYKKYYGYSMADLSLYKREDGTFDVMVNEVPRTNFVPKTGLFYSDYSEDTTIKYRELAEYGTYLLEYDSGTLGLLNKAVPHVLFKRFGQSCWSELCEIYGIPPRVMKTNTQDPTSLERAEQMMRDMGNAAWFIIDESEKFEWATGIQTNGDVYKHMIALCNNELSLLISGAVIGQDTEHGNRSKEESSQDMLWQLVLSDLAELESDWNNITLPALGRLGILKPGLRFEFDQIEDIDKLWEITKDLLPFKKFKDEWLKEKFGVEVAGDVEQKQSKLSADFFV